MNTLDRDQPGPAPDPSVSASAAPAPACPRGVGPARRPMRLRALLVGAAVRWRALLRAGLVGLAVLGLLALSALFAIDASVTLVTHGAITARVDAVPPTPVALLLGTARTHQGRPNQFYRARIEAAAALFLSGRVQGILVSGDNATMQYNEPIAMRKDLVALGVPTEYITLDYAGFRTLDSVVRAKAVFGLQRLVVVSQRFHAERAIFIARHYGIDASGLAAADPTARGLMWIRAREVLARAAALLDLLTGRGPRFLGDRETVHLRESAQGAVGADVRRGSIQPAPAPGQSLPAAGPAPPVADG